MAPTSKRRHAKNPGKKPSKAKYPPLGPGAIVATRQFFISADGRPLATASPGISWGRWYGGIVESVHDDELYTVIWPNHNGKKSTYVCGDLVIDNGELEKKDRADRRKKLAALGVLLPSSDAEDDSDQNEKTPSTMETGNNENEDGRKRESDIGRSQQRAAAANSFKAKQEVTMKRKRIQNPKGFLVELLKDKVSCDEEEVKDLVSEHIELCREEYRFRVRWFLWDAPQRSNRRVSLLRKICELCPSLEMVRMVYEAYPQAIQKADLPDEGYSRSDGPSWLPLHAACYYGASLDVVHFLASKYQDGVKEKDIYGDTPLHLECRNGQSFDCIQVLVYACKDALKEKNNDGDLPLQRACRSGASFGIIKFLVSGYEDALKEKNRRGENLLHWACHSNVSLEAVQLLLSVYNDGLKEKNRDGQIPLHLECLNTYIHPSLDVIQLVVSGYKDGLKEKDMRGELPLHLIFRRFKSLDIIQFMVSGYRNGLKDKNEDGATPFHVACDEGVATDVLCSLSCYPEVLDLLFPDGNELDAGSISRRMPWWEIRQDNSGAFVWYQEENFGLIQNPTVEDHILGIRCDGAMGEAQITSMLPNYTHMKGIIAVGGGMHSHLVQPFTNALEAFDELLYLRLDNNPIGDAGAEILASALATSKTLEMLGAQSCGIGAVGLSSILQALHENEVVQHLDLSYNSGIFNAHGGQAVASNLTRMTNLKRLCLFCDDDGFSMEYVAFLSELMQPLHWSPSIFSCVLLSQLTPRMVHAIYWYQQKFHNDILISDPSRRGLIWHFLLEQASVLYQCNADLIFFYVREMIVC